MALQEVPRGDDGVAPWRIGDVIGLYAGTMAGASVLLLAWWGASGTTDLGTQVGWVTVGVSGVLVTGVANTIWLVSGRRGVGRRQRQLLASYEPGAPVADEAPDLRDAPPAAGFTFVSSPTMTRYHRPDCPLVVGKDVTPLGSLSDDASRRACGVCGS